MIELAPGERLYVFAGSYAIAMNWARRQGLRRDQITHVRDYVQLMGVARGLRYVVLHGGQLNQEMRATLACREAVEVDP